MKPRWWLTFHPRDGVIFVAAVGAAIAMWHVLPPEVRGQFLRPRVRHGINPVEIMFVAWFTGWFGLLFVRIEDLNVLAPINYQAGMRFVAGLFIAIAVMIAILHLSVL